MHVMPGNYCAMFSGIFFCFLGTLVRCIREIMYNMPGNNCPMCSGIFFWFLGTIGPGFRELLNLMPGNYWTWFQGTTVPDVWEPARSRNASPSLSTLARPWSKPRDLLGSDPEIFSPAQSSAPGRTTWVIN